MLARVVSGGSVGVACGASVGVVLGTLAGLAHLMLDGTGKYPGITVAGGIYIALVAGAPTGAIVGACVERSAITSARAAAAVLAGAVVSALVGLSLGFFFIESTISMLAGASIA